MDDGAVVLDHVNLLNARDVVDRKLLEAALELLVIGGGRAVDDLLLPPASSY